MLETIKKIFSPNLIVAFLMGMASGLPLLITITLMQAWAKESGITLQDIGLMSLVGLPYTLKFLWAPLFDRFTIPGFGRRRGWLIINQIAVMCFIAAMGFVDPANNAGLFVFMGLLVSFFSASQDIVIDAYRRESLNDNELGLGSSYYIYGYRLGMLVVSGGGMILADHISWTAVYLIMAACLLPGLVTTFFCREPEMKEAPPRNFKESVIDPFVDFFRKDGAVWILIFILMYKLGDNLAGALTTPFYLDLQFTKTEIGAVVKLFGFWATLIGAFLGGVVMLKIGIKRSLLIFGVLQMISTAGFALLAQVGHSIPLLGVVISFENLTAGMGTAAFVAFMAQITSKKFTATQYALLSSLMGVPRVVLSSVTGFMAESMGWFVFYVFCTLIALPGMLLLFKISHQEKSSA